MIFVLTIADANLFFDTYVVHNQPWVKAKDEVKQRALNNAEYILYHNYNQSYNKSDPEKQMPTDAILWEALWLLRQDESIMKQDFNVTGLSVEGMSIQMKGEYYPLISPDAERIIEDDLNHRNPNDDNYYNGKFGWSVM